jgi:hypothetical protein
MDYALPVGAPDGKCTYAHPFDYNIWLDPAWGSKRIASGTRKSWLSSMGEHGLSFVSEVCVCHEGRNFSCLSYNAI